MASESGHEWGNHIVPLVRLGTETLIADVGIRDGTRSPLHLVEGSVAQVPFQYQLKHLGGTLWRFCFDRRACIPGLDLDVAPVGLSHFQAWHVFSSTAQESFFVRNFVAQKRGAESTLTLHGCVLTRVHVEGTSSLDILDERDWLSALEGEIGVRLVDVSRRELHDLWQRVRARHEIWEQAGRP